MRDKNIMAFVTKMTIGLGFLLWCRSLDIAPEDCTDDLVLKFTTSFEDQLARSLERLQKYERK